jgi:APA family basic amino acid/polyamine antiporter
MAFKRRLNLIDATLIVVGNTVGAGIFTTVGFLAGQISDPRLFIGIWIVGGLLTLCGALTYGEMAAMYPSSGGDYLYLKAAYGPWAGFLLGWVCFWIINPGSIAVLSIALVKYLSGFSGQLGAGTEKLLAAMAIFFFSIVNYRGVRLTGTTQNLWTLGSLALLIVFIVGGLASGRGDWAHLAGGSTDIIPAAKFLGPAMVSVLFCYSGWFVTAYIGDEIKNPKRNLPLSLTLGTLIVAVLYVTINIVYLYALPVASIKGAVNVGQLAAQRLLSTGSVQIITVALVLAIAANMNATILAGTRLSYVLARDGLFWSHLDTLHARHGTPHAGLLVQALIACLYVLIDTFEGLLSAVVFVMLISSIGSGLAHLILRKREPAIERPYKTWGYPFTPLLFVGAYSWIALQVFMSSPARSLLGIAIMLSGVPFYLQETRRRRLAAQDALSSTCLRDAEPKREAR